MAICQVCGKDNIFGRRISINRSQVSKRAKRRWQPNVQSVKVVVNGTHKTMKVCTKCLRNNKVVRA